MCPACWSRARGINAGYFKPALSGAEREGGRLVPGDARWVCRTAGLPGDPADYVAYLYEQAVSPHLAARLEGPPIELAAILERQRAVGERFAYLVAEGCGGLFCPLREGEPPLLLADVAAAIGFDLLLVASVPSMRRWSRRPMPSAWASRCEGSCSTASTRRISFIGTTGSKSPALPACRWRPCRRALWSGIRLPGCPERGKIRTTKKRKRL